MDAVSGSDSGFRLVELAAARADYVRYARCFALPTGDAEDVVQEAFAILAAKMAELGSPDPHAYLKGIVRRLCLTRRRALRLPTAPGVDPDQLFDRYVAERSDRADALEHCLERLAPRARNALYLTYHQGLTSGEVGIAMGLRRDGVRSLLKRTRAALRRCVNQRLERES